VFNDDEGFPPPFACEESERVVESAEAFAVTRHTISFDMVVDSFAQVSTWKTLN
jgi:hypothetical protein